MEKLYTLKEVTEILKVTFMTLYRWRESGKLKVVKIGNTIRVPESELKRLMKGE